MTTNDIIDDLIDGVIEIARDDELDRNGFYEQIKELRDEAVRSIENINNQD